ncbi:hypothetical protein BKA70DRAFT_1232284 [Coprinopsis sp. MPI-PUGE-AT-0042]|nr:hypothetical protein BKA70DRAFT_1232284 [Coprinopsis sp. MPI-PUGE-AT-0042]
MLSSLLHHGFNDNLISRHISQSHSEQARAAQNAQTSSNSPILTLRSPSQVGSHSQLHANSWITGTPAQARPLPSLGVGVELVEETVSRQRLMLHPPAATSTGNMPGQTSVIENMVFINLTALGLDTVLPPNSKDYVVAAVKLAKATMAREEKLKEIDGAIEGLRDLISQYNLTNDDTAFSSSLFEAVKARYRATPTVAEFMNTLVSTLILQETPL